MKSLIGCLLMGLIVVAGCSGSDDKGTPENPEPDIKWMTGDVSDTAVSDTAVPDVALPETSTDIGPADLADAGSDTACQPQCLDKQCGDDGCGGKCGQCPENHVCLEDGTCLCFPSCTGKECGSDGCDGDCGDCPQGWQCDNGTCNQTCIPDCEGKECGDDGCDGVCGLCNILNHECIEGACVCVPDCEEKECGDDGCWGTCGECVDPQQECQQGKCVCKPDCEGKECGDDGCGGLCGFQECKDIDEDGVPDDEDAFPNDPTEWADSDADGTGDNADLDDDNDGLLDTEEADFGTDCNITDPLNPDTDSDGVKDSADAYPNDPFPAFLIMQKNNGHMWVFLTDDAGGFQDPIEVGADLPWECAETEKCDPVCQAGTHCEVGQCVADNPDACPQACSDGFVCRSLQYRSIYIADFDSDGLMDFIAHSWPKKESGTMSLWFFYRLEEGGSFPQTYVGEVPETVAGVVADVNSDFRFDFVKYWAQHPDYYGSGGAYSFLGGGPMTNAECVIGQPAEGCTFSSVNPALDVTPQISGQWGFSQAWQAADMDGDLNQDLVFGTYASGGSSDTKIYLSLGNGDGTFQQASHITTHPGSKGPANSFLFADFTGDQVGDVLLGFDDDGDAGSGWLYTGNVQGVFSSVGTKVLDLNPDCNSGCGDKVGVCHTAKVFDFNFDGAMDVVTGHQYCDAQPNCYVWTAPDSILQVHYGNGDGTFQSAMTVYKALGSFEATAFAVPTRICPWYVL